jgi:hypothetical protein
MTMSDNSNVKIVSSITITISCITNKLQEHDIITWVGITSSETENLLTYMKLFYTKKF